MPLYDLPEPELSAYRSSAEPPPDFDAFWPTTLAQARALRRPPKVEPVDTGLRLVETFDVEFTGFDGDPVYAWYHRPAGAPGGLPVVVRFQGYGAGRGLPHQLSTWVPAGYACLEVDTRGQGSAGGLGDTPDPAGSGPAYPGFLTRGILSPDTYYYRRVFTDAVLAVDCARTLPGVDGTRVAVTGCSQGGGIALAVAGLSEGITAVLADVPFLSDFRRGASVAGRPPYTELAGYLGTRRDHVERAFRTLDYFDVSVLVRGARAPALFSVALMDEVCPPSTVYAAYNAYAGPKDIRRYPFNDHEGGQYFHEAEQLRWLNSRMPPSEIPRSGARR